MYRMYKGELELRTPYVKLVNILLKQGWKFKYNELSELI